MPQEPLRMGVVGVGLMGERHARVIARIRGCILAALADVDEERVRRIAGELGAAAYTDFRTMLREAELDAVSICLPDDRHLEAALAAAAAGKAILLEKPIATRVDEAVAIVEACRQAGVILQVGHLLRFDNRYAAVKQAIDRGDLGEIVHITAHRNSPWTQGPSRYRPGTSLTMHVAVHDLDLVNWYTGSRPVRVYAERVRKRLRDRDMDDAVTAILRFESGAVATLQYSWVLPARSVTQLDARLEVLGTRGMATVGTYHGQSVLVATDDGADAPDVHHGPTVAGQVKGDVREEIMAFVETVLKGGKPLVDGADALLAVQEAEAIERSLRLGTPVLLDEARAR